MSQTFALLVVGGGPAGLAAARAFREAGGDGPTAIVTDEQRMPYQRPPLTKDLLRGESEEADLPLESEEWLSESGVALIGGRAVALAVDERTVTLSGGRELGYERCVLATGAEPTRPPIPGADDPAVRVLRTLDHLREIERRLEPGSEVAVIGSGFIGCEIAASLRRREHPVTLLSGEQAPNAARLGSDAARELAGWLAGEGVTLHLGAEVEAIERYGTRLEVSSRAGRASASLVVMATGVAPRGELAAAAGARLDQGAVPAGSDMRTELAGVLAAGDVCRAVNARAGRALHVEHWGDALEQGAVAGRVAAGADAVWEQVPGFWSTIGEHTLKYAAWGDGYDDCALERGPGGAFTVWYGCKGKLVGVLAHERDQAYERGQELISEGAAWTSTP